MVRVRNIPDLRETNAGCLYHDAPKSDLLAPNDENGVAFSRRPSTTEVRPGPQKKTKNERRKMKDERQKRGTYTDVGLEGMEDGDLEPLRI
jgi:hypothetical protein